MSVLGCVEQRRFGNATPTQKQTRECEVLHNCSFLSIFFFNWQSVCWLSFGYERTASLGMSIITKLFDKIRHIECLSYDGQRFTSSKSVPQTFDQFISLLKGFKLHVRLMKITLLCVHMFLDQKSSCFSTVHLTNMIWLNLTFKWTLQTGSIPTFLKLLFNAPNLIFGF